MAYFLCMLVHGPSWDDARGIREQDDWQDHAAFMDRLVEQGLIIIGGPVGTGEHTAHLIESEDAGEIRARLAEDPWAKDNHLMVGALDPWALWARRTSARGVTPTSMSSMGPQIAAPYDVLRR